MMPRMSDLASTSTVLRSAAPIGAMRHQAWQAQAGATRGSEELHLPNLREAFSYRVPCACACACADRSCASLAGLVVPPLA